jgi:hypothetical protein
MTADGYYLIQPSPWVGALYAVTLLNVLLAV